MDVREKATNDKRLIDANVLMDVIRQHEYRLATKQGSIDYGMFTLGIQQAVDEQPPVDAVPVVRCKECKWTGGDFVCYRGVMVQHKPEDFCSYGKRKEGAEC